MIDIASLSVAYPGGNVAVNDITLHIGAGESVALIGANGAGKSTLLSAVVGLVPVSAGSISVGGRALSKKTLPEIRRRVGFVFQDPDDQLFMPTVGDDVAFGVRNYGLPDSNAAEAMEKLGITHLAGRIPSQLSGGEKRLAAIAGIIALGPDAILFDEPSAFLDPRARRELISIIASLPCAKLIATHDLPFAAALCRRTVVLKSGKIFTDGASRDILDNEILLTECGL